jgi:ribosomal protein L37AE/L43A
LDQAKALLKAAWDQEDDSGIKAEIKRRLKQLEPEDVNQIKCSICGKLFQPKRIKKFKNNYCGACLEKGSEAEDSNFVRSLLIHFCQFKQLNYGLKTFVF